MWMAARRPSRRRAAPSIRTTEDRAMWLEFAGAVCALAYGLHVIGVAL
jgi:hypothetical protein